MNRPVTGQSRSGPDASPVESAGSPASRRRARRTLLAVLAVCIAPVLASYATYYWFKPAGRTNYGDLIRPLRDVTALPIRPLVVPSPVPGERVLPMSASRTVGMGAFAGRWVMVVLAPTPCDQGCRDRLYKIRQVRLTTGKNRNRVERLWLIPTSQASAPPKPDPDVINEHTGLWVATIEPAGVASNFVAQTGADSNAHIFLIDPLSKLMMRFPVDADPNRMKKDLSKLLRASRVG